MQTCLFYYRHNGFLPQLRFLCGCCVVVVCSAGSVKVWLDLRLLATSGNRPFEWLTKRLAFTPTMKHKMSELLLTLMLSSHSGNFFT